MLIALFTHGTVTTHLPWALMYSAEAYDDKKAFESK